MKTMSSHTAPRRWRAWGCMGVLLMGAALAGCEREPTPKMSSADMNTPTTTAQGDTGTALGTGSVASATPGPTPSVLSGSPSGTPDAPSSGRSTQSAAQAGLDVEAMTRDRPSAAGVPGDAATTQGAAAATAGALNAAEQKFIAEAGARNLFDIRVAELAAQKASDPALQSYAAMVAADQKGAGEELKRLAAGHGVSLPQTLLPQDQKTLSALRNAQRAAFDQQYLRTAGIYEHEKTIAAFEKASADARNPAVKDYVQSTLTTLKAHLEAARRLQAKG